MSGDLGTGLSGRPPAASAQGHDGARSEPGRAIDTQPAPVLALALRILLVVLATLLTFYAASLASAFGERQHYRGRVAEAVASGALTRGVALPLARASRVSIHNFNDCLILSMLVLPQEDDIFRRALSPRVPSLDAPWSGEAPSGYPPYVQCRDLALAIEPAADVPVGYYHRYLHGDWVLAKLLLAVLPFAYATNLLLILLVAGLVGLALLALRNAVRRPGTAGRDCAYAVLALTLLLFYALPVFGWSFSFAPADLVLVGFLLFFYLRPPSALSELEFATAAALFGALTAMFEFLTGGSPSGLILIFAVVLFDDAVDPRAIWRRLCIGTVSFTAAIVLCFAFKMAAVAVIWGLPELTLFGQQIGAHMSSAGWEVAPENAARLARLGIDPDAIRSSFLFSYLYALSKVFYFSQFLAFGSVELGLLLVALAPLLLGLRQGLLLRRCSEAVERMRAGLLLVACAIMPAWYLAFVHHTIVHAHFMFRPMVWPLALLLAMEAWRRTGQKQSAKAG
ncbi:hypothetical protein LJR009_006218 [Bosea sp. LjRoot9]|uniref:hypothetical protein n=1 Tax=Bosea sp. LjRoot9 TaxID=3342341 RepID=UPI003ECD7E9A